MSKQVIISISREYGSGGHLIAEWVAEKFGLKFYDRNMLDEIAGEMNMEVGELEKYDERRRNPLITRRVGAHSNSMEDILIEKQFEYLREKADSGESFVVVGRCAETVLKGREGLITIFVLGDKDKKLERIMDKYHLDRKEAIAKIIRHDKNRKSYHNRYSDMKWGDSRGYDLCINSSRLGLERTAETLENYIQERIRE